MNKGCDKNQAHHRDLELESTPLPRVIQRNPNGRLFRIEMILLVWLETIKFMDNQHEHPTQHIGCSPYPRPQLDNSKRRLDLPSTPNKCCDRGRRTMTLIRLQTTLLRRTILSLLLNTHLAPVRPTPWVQE